MKKTKRFTSVAEAAHALGLDTDQQLADFLDISRPHATKLRNGRRYRSLIEPMRVAVKLGVALEHLVEQRVQGRHILTK